MLFFVSVREDSDKMPKKLFESEFYFLSALKKTIFCITIVLIAIMTSIIFTVLFLDLRKKVYFCKLDARIGGVVMQTVRHTEHGEPTVDARRGQSQVSYIFF